ncbi:MAG: hypothetical protein AB7P01_06155 [Bacteroidia bacterium]
MNEQEIKELIAGILSGKYVAQSLPYSLFNQTSKQLIEAFEGGWGENKLSHPDVYSPDLELFNSFRKNLYYFSANKTAKQVKELQALIHDEQGNRRTVNEFTAEALKVDEAFNKRYLEAEYDMTFKLAHSGREWRDIEATKETFPILEWVAVMDANTRHGEFNGIKLPVDHPFWDSHPIPYQWGCRCRYRQHRKADITTTIPDVPEPSKLFRNNVYKSQQVWKNDIHPYGQDLSKEDRAGVTKLINDAIANLPLIKLKTSNGSAAVHPYHAPDKPDELEKNIRASLLLAEKYGHDIKLLPELSTEADIKHPDAEIDNSLAEYKRPGTRTGVYNRLREAVDQKVKVVVFDNKKLSAETIYRATKGYFQQRKEETTIKEIWAIVNGTAVKTKLPITEQFYNDLLKAEGETP